MWRDIDLVVDHLLWNAFPKARRQPARSALTALLMQCSSTYVPGVEGIMKQALVLSFPGRALESLRFEGEALIYLTLWNGRVVCLRCWGDVVAASAHLGSIASCLADRRTASLRQATLERRMTDVLNAAARTPTTLRWVHHAPVAPDAAVCHFIIYTKCRAAFDEIQRKHGYIGSRFDSATGLLSYLEQQFDINGGAIALFRAGLTPAILDRLDEIARPFTHRTRQLGLYNFFVSRRATIPRNRAQALTELPWLVPVLTGMDAAEWRVDEASEPHSVPLRPKLQCAAGRLLAAIDQGHPLFASVSSILKIPKETVRWSRRKVLPSVGFFSAFDADLLLIALSWIAPEKRPASATAWKRFAGITCDCLEILCQFNYRYSRGAVALSPVQSSLSAVRHAPIAGAMARWVRDLFHQSGSGDGCSGWEQDRLHVRLARVPAFMHALYRAIQRFCVSDRRGRGLFDPDAAFLQSWLCAQDIRSLTRRSDAFHRQVAQWGLGEEAIDSPGMCRERHAESVSWPAVLDEPFLWQERSIHEIVSATDLAIEGEAMHHCVGSYAGRCVRDDSLIFSIRDGAGRRCTTVEIRVDEQTLEARIMAHRARRNSEPDALSVAAADELVRYLNTPGGQQRLRERVDGWRRRRNDEDALDMQTLLAADADAYARRVAELAWRCAFGTDPLACQSYPVSFTRA